MAECEWRSADTIDLVRRDRRRYLQTDSRSPRVIKWDGVSVRRLGGTWTLLVRNRDLAFVPVRVLNAEETEKLRRRARPD